MCECIKDNSKQDDERLEDIDWLNEYIDSHNEHARETAQFYDKALITLSSSSLAAILLFYYNMRDVITPVGLVYILACSVAFTASISATIFSYLANNISIAIIRKKLIRGKITNQDIDNVFDRSVFWLNLFSGILLVSGYTLLVFLLLEGLI